MTRNFWRPSSPILFLILFLSRAQGQMVVDQSNTGPGGGGSASTSGIQGQSFTPTLTGIDFCTFKIADYDTSFPGGKAYFSISKGNNGGGDAIGNTNTVTIPPDTQLTPVPYTFYFPSRVALDPGQVYSLSLRVNSGIFAISVTDRIDPYNGGNYYAANYIPNEDADAYFIEGIVPEPASAALLTIPVLIGCARRSNRRQKVAGSKLNA